MSELTLQEIYNATKITRRAIQGYEKWGLVVATGKTERGYLLYDEAAQERIQKIKLYQDFGLSLREIKNVIDAPAEVEKRTLEQILIKLKGDREYIGTLIERANEMIEQL